MTPARTAVHVIIEGRVQGVGFRAFVEREAKTRNLGGWVRNRADGSVEAVFAGEPTLVRSMVEACHRGPRLASVRAVKTSIHPEQDWTGFAIWPTE
jgi:acylphosphatase